jgi:LysM repeat protein
MVARTRYGDRGARSRREAMNTPRPRGCVRTLLAVSVGLVLIIGASMAATAFLYLSEWTLPGVQAMGVEVGGKTRAEAVSLLQREWQRRTVVLEAEGMTWTLPPDRLGIILDAEATVRLAHQQGRSPDTLQKVLATKGHITIAPIWTFERGAAEALLHVLAGQVHVPPGSASLRIVEGRIEATTPVAGRALDVAATLDWLERHAWQILQDERLDLVIVALPPIALDLTAAAAEADRLLSSNVSMQLYDPIGNERFVWTPTPAIVGDWLSLRGDPANAEGLRWEVEPERVKDFLRERSTELGPDRYVEVDGTISAIIEALRTHQPNAYARVYHYHRQHTVQAGETLSSIALDYGVPYPWIQQANPRLDDLLRAGQVLSIPSPDVFLPLPPVENKRIVVRLSQQRLWAYEDDRVKWEWPVSTGKASSPTSPGVFQIQSHNLNAYAANWDLWMPYFMGIYKPVPTSEFMNGFHGYPKRGESQVLWAGNLGDPVTYGCVMVSTENATQLYEWAEEGVVVEIQR